MKSLIVKLALNVVLISLVAIIILTGGAGSGAVAAAQPAAGAATQPEAIVVMYGPDGAALVRPANPGAHAGILLQGTSPDIFYLTPEGTRRQIADRDTLLAFGLTAENVIRVGDDFLNAIPLAGKLTRLVRSGQDNLYWVMAGQRWLVNEWSPVIARTTYSDIPVTPLDGWLEQHLPTRLTLASGMLLRDATTVYYFDAGTLIPVSQPVYDEVQVIDVPAGVLAVYPQKTRLEQIYLRLNDEAPVVTVRRGPGLRYEAVGPVANKVLLQGRARDGEWVLTTYQDQPAWLAASVIPDQVALGLLPTVGAAPLAGPDLSPYQVAASIEILP